MAAPSSLQVFAEEVRYYMRDFPELNRIISGEESSTRMVEMMALLALEEWNAYSPVSFAAVDQFPNKLVLMLLTIIHLLQSAGILHSRNRMSYSDGGWTTDTEVQADEYPKWISLLRAQVGPLMNSMSIRLNIARAWGGGVHSEYLLLNSYYGWQ